MSKYNKIITLIITMLMVVGCSLNNFADPTVGTVTDDGEIDPSIFIPGTITYHDNGKIKSGTLYGVQTLTHGAQFGHPDNTGTGRIMLNVQGGTITNAVTDKDIEIITNEDITRVRNTVTNSSISVSNEVDTNGITNTITYTNVEVVTTVTLITNVEVFTNIFARDGSYVTFHDNGVVQSGDLYGTNGINGRRWYSRVKLHTNGIVKEGVISVDDPFIYKASGLNSTLVSNARGPFLASIHSFLEFYENGYIRKCILRSSFDRSSEHPDAPNRGIFTNNRFNDGTTGYMSISGIVVFNRDGSLFKEYAGGRIIDYSTNDWIYTN